MIDGLSCFFPCSDAKVIQIRGYILGSPVQKVVLSTSRSHNDVRPRCQELDRCPDSPRPLTSNYLPTERGRERERVRQRECHRWLMAHNGHWLLGRAEVTGEIFPSQSYCLRSSLSYWINRTLCCNLGSYLQFDLTRCNTNRVTHMSSSAGQSIEGVKALLSLYDMNYNFNDLILNYSCSMCNLIQRSSQSRLTFILA